MNYRHAYHAGNFADVLKHAVLCRVLAHLREKPAAFRVVDTHAGAGLYDLSGPEAARTGEWQNGIGRLAKAALGDDVRALLAPYLDAVTACNRGVGLTRYPGSPLLARALLRPQDRLTACELEPHAAAALAHQLRGDPRTKAIAVDGWTALNACLPPTERRGVVLVDPPFEQAGEFARLERALQAAHRKWATGIYMLWYPVKEGADAAAFARRLARLDVAKQLRVELAVAPPSSGDEGLRRSGLIVVNPPYRLPGELKVLIPALAAALSGGGKPVWTLDWQPGETSR